MIRTTLLRQRLVAVHLAGLVLLNYPLIALFDRPIGWLGIPAIYLYLFIVWLGLILTMAWVSRERKA